MCEDDSQPKEADEDLTCSARQLLQKNEVQMACAAEPLVGLKACSQALNTA